MTDSADREDMDLRKTGKALAGILLAVMICFGTAAGLADVTMHREADDPAIEMTAEIGYQGVMTYGKAIPLRVRIRNNGVADLEGTLGINAYMNTRQYNRFETSISVPPGAEKEYVLPFSVLTRQETFTPEIVTGGRVAEAVNLHAVNAVDPDTVFVGVLSTRPNRLANLDYAQGNDMDYSWQSWKLIALNAETFPDQDVLLDAFGVLIIDDIDPASLSKKQQEALERWLEGRHILLCGSSAGSVAYFSDRTGLEVTGAETSRQVLAKLEKLADISSSGNRLSVAVTRLAGATPLIADDSGNGLVFRTETGNGRIYTVAFEMTESGVFGLRPMRYFWQRMLENYDNTLYYSLQYASYGSSEVVYPGNSIAVPVHSPVLAVALICAGALALGWVIWLILKRKGKQTWMWLALPALAAAAAAAVLVISGGADTNKPLVTYAESLVQRADGSAVRVIGINAAASRAGMHSYQIEGAPVSLQYRQDVSYDYYYEDRKNTEPTEMVMCYRTGDGETLSLRSDTPWEMKSLESEGALSGIGRISAEIWMEDDGLHGTIRNDTTLRLKAGRVITGYGYVSVPALAPGETTAFMLRETPPVAGNYGTAVPADGEMNRNSSFYLYNILEAALGISPEGGNTSGPLMTRQEIINAALYRITGGYYDYGQKSAFLYTTETEDKLPLGFVIDGKPVRNVAGVTVVNAEITYLPVGKTGLVYRMPGMARAVRMNVDENGLPGGEAERISDYDKYGGGGYSLSEQPVFRFTLERPEDVEITSLRVSLSYNGDIARCCLLNVRTGEWDRISLDRDVSNPADYVNADGQLFCRFELNGAADYDVTITEPDLSMEGRKLHAEN